MSREDLAVELVRALPSIYSPTTQDGEEPFARAEHVLGMGGSSVVVRAVQHGRLKRAIKILAPRDDLKVDLDSGKFADSFENEIEVLSQLSHEHISKLTDFGTLTVAKSTYPYVVMDLITGDTLKQFSENESTSGAEILSAFDQVLAALSYVHARGVLHADVKEENILVSTFEVEGARQVSAVLVDLGASRSIGQPDATDDNAYVYFFSTQKYVIPKLLPYLANHSSNRIRKKDLRKFFPAQDLYSFGIMLESLLNSKQAVEKLSLHLGNQGIRGLSYIRDRLVQEAPESMGYATAQQVRDALERLPQFDAPSLYVAELAPVDVNSFALPNVHKRVPRSDRVNSITVHPMFQRLHRLPQLDLLQLILPGGSHTRFAHALHSFDLARDAIMHQMTDWRFRLGVSKDDVENTLFAALVDSVGHYHFLHMFEDFLQDKNDKFVKSAGLMSDSEVLNSILTDADNPIGRIARTIKNPAGFTLAETLEQAVGRSWEEIRTTTQTPQNSVQGLLASLLSSPVDVDKLAYLIDDSAAANLSFGRAVEPSAIFRALTVMKDEEWQGTPLPKAGVGLQEDAVSYVENAVLARYWSIQAGYWVRGNRAMQAMVKFVLGMLIKTGNFRFAEYFEQTHNVSTDAALRHISDLFESAKARGDIDKEVVNPAGQLLMSKEASYTRIVTISPRSRLPRRGPDHMIYDALSKTNAFDFQTIHDLVSKALKTVVPDAEFHLGEILADLPRVRREQTGGTIAVYAGRPQPEHLGELYSVSPVLAELKDSFDLLTKRLRIFVSPRIVTELGDDFERGHTAVLEALRSRYDR